MSRTTKDRGALRRAISRRAARIMRRRELWAEVERARLVAVLEEKEGGFNP